MKREPRRVMYFSGNWSRAHYFGRRGKCACGKFGRWEAVDYPPNISVRPSWRCVAAMAHSRCNIRKGART